VVQQFAIVAGTLTRLFNISLRIVTLSEGRKGVDPEVFNIAQDSGLWKDDKGGKALVKELSSFISKYFINFPVKLGRFPFTRGSALDS